MDLNHRMAVRVALKCSLPGLVVPVSLTVKNGTGGVRHVFHQVNGSGGLARLVLSSARVGF